jgi:nitronate monooxygenase
VFDTVRGLAWPDPYTGRGLRNPFMNRWSGRERELVAALDVERDKYRAAARSGDLTTAVVWAGEAVDLIVSVARAATLVHQIGAQAEALLTTGVHLVTGDHAGRQECNAGSQHPSA